MRENPQLCPWRWCIHPIYRDQPSHQSGYSAKPPVGRVHPAEEELSESSNIAGQCISQLSYGPKKTNQGMVDFMTVEMSRQAQSSTV
ncbi:hypothetical protein AVEN_8614-1 [Araneus ventricosus]|uniref:Uncharacterized protein n=1 Tax=Araneus ventricosus TaxID=182803 RepID=A0A4Y2C2K8_ARAVE|nr:hypothetical protein AVEN_8614-1 [Araneus ventricosus]